MSVTYLVVTIVGYQLFKSGRIFEKKSFLQYFRYLLTFVKSIEIQ